MNGQISIPDDGDAIKQSLWPLKDELRSTERVNAVIATYKLRTGHDADPPYGNDYLASVRKWMLDPDDSMPTDDMGFSTSLFFTSKQRSEPIVHPGIESKASWLQQAPCTTCLRLPMVRPLKISFAVRTRPFSAQYLGSRPGKLKQLNENIKLSFADRFKDLEGWSGCQLCVRIVASVSQKDPLKDVDNMAKGLLDSFQDALFKNDKNIAHLSIERLSIEGTEGYYMVSIQPVDSALADVVDKQLHMNG